MHKPYRRLAKRRNAPVVHPTGLSKDLLQHRIAKKISPAGAVTPGELEQDMLRFIAERYADRHVDIEVAQLGLSNVAQRLIVAHLTAVAAASPKKAR